MGPHFARVRATIFAVIGFIFLAAGVGVTVGTLDLARNSGGKLHVYMYLDLKEELFMSNISHSPWNSELVVCILHACLFLSDCLSVCLSVCLCICMPACCLSFCVFVFFRSKSLCIFQVPGKRTLNFWLLFASQKCLCLSSLTLPVDGRFSLKRY